MALDPVAWSVSLTLELAIRTETEKREEKKEGEGRGGEFSLQITPPWLDKNH